MSSLALKRFTDVVLSALGLIFLGPVMAVIFIVVRVRLGSPVLFRQERPGRHAVPFELVKFRTMTDAIGPDGLMLPDAERVTSFGRWLRATSLDELPELWNVLRGDMSLVGPRPLLMKYLPLFDAEQARRHAVRPGLTGWAQINGRNATSWERRFALDVWYVDHRSARLDWRIMIRTLAAVVGRDGISASGHQTMPEFTGSQSVT